MIAELVFPEHDSWIGDAKIYRLDPPYEGHEHVAITVHPVAGGEWQNAGVDVVGCTAEGLVPGAYVVAVYQTYVVMTHAEVLGVLGYSLQEAP
ncbi:hypothetical protein AB0H76_15415 [Nocardia sp. NPDC050712]|uniref:hypothetical protein n=1 Tax=Nocardia sp. NPDC050712 TaxID=3155518 RepID=UPI00340ABE52